MYIHIYIYTYIYIYIYIFIYMNIPFVSVSFPFSLRLFWLRRVVPLDKSSSAQAQPLHPGGDRCGGGAPCGAFATPWERRGPYARAAHCGKSGHWRWSADRYGVKQWSIWSRDATWPISMGMCAELKSCCDMVWYIWGMPEALYNSLYICICYL